MILNLNRLLHHSYFGPLLMITMSLLFVWPEATYAQTVVVAPPSFSVERGFYSATFSLTLTSSTPNAQIRYTLDGATPSPTSGQLYSGPLNITGTTVVRAVAYTSATDKSAVVTHSYLFLASLRQQTATPPPGWPAFFAADDGNGPYPADYEMDAEIYNHANYRTIFDEAMQALPAISLVTDLPNLWSPTAGIYYNPNKKGDTWERAASIEWIDPAGGAGFAENVGIRLHGGASRRPYRTPKKTLRVYFRTIYGAPKLDFPVFADPNAVQRFDHLLLRGGSNRSWIWWETTQRRDTDYINDEFARVAALEMGQLAPHGTFAHLYLNGLYWGLYNVTERVHENMLSAYYGGTDLDYDLISVDENNGAIVVAEAGDLVAWDKVMALADQAPISPSTYQQILEQLDVVSLVDYIILTHYVANTDWPYHNWYAYRKRVGQETRLKFMTWDSDSSLRQVQENVTLNDVANTPAHLFLQLVTQPDFRQLVSDRLYLHTTGSGALTAQRCATRYSALAALVNQAVIGESARWGDYTRDVYHWTAGAPTGGSALPAYLYSRDLPLIDADPTNAVDDKQQKTWVQVRDEKLANYCPKRTQIFVNQYIANGWYSPTLQPPAFAQNGGAIPVGFALSITNPNSAGAGEIYYTVDGADPRAAGGSVAAGAVNGGDSSSLPMNQVATVRARVKQGAQWSPLIEATFYPPQPMSALVINELHYHPAAPVGVNDDLQEFIELHNRGTLPLRLDRVSFRRGFTYQFPLNTTLPAGGYLVLASDPAKFESIYKFAPFASYVGNLSNNGEAIELVDALGAVIDSVNYGDLQPWPQAADGTGPSLELINPDLDNNEATSWLAALPAAGTPGAQNSTFQVVNQRPLVNFTAPLDGAQTIVGSPVLLSATANDSDGAVTEVRFFVDGVLLPNCVVTQPPYQCQWTPTTSGNYSLLAQATDNRSASGISTGVTIHVHKAVNQLPATRITSPNNDATLAPGPVAIGAEASDSDGQISQVAFLVNGVALVDCLDTQAPYECTWTPPTAGAYALTTQATDNDGGVTLSSLVQVTVVKPNNQLPVVAISNPTTAITLTAGAPFELQATASDSDGQINQVTFFANQVSLHNCIDTAPPFTCSWVPTVGTYTLTAVATDDDNSNTTSAPVTVQVLMGSDGVSAHAYLPLVRR